MGRKTWQPGPCERVLLGLARDRLDQEALAACDPEELTVLARRHKVMAPLAALVEADAGSPAGWKLWAARVTLSSSADRERLERGLLATVGLLNAAQIPTVLLKGSSLAHGHPRDVGDADLLLDPRHIKAAIAVLEDHGYRYQGFDRNLRIRQREFRDWDKLLAWSNQFEFSEPTTGALVELHSGLFEAGRVYSLHLGAFQGDPAPFLDRAVPDGALRVLRLEDSILLLAVHLAVKRSPDQRSFILRHVLDLAALETAGPDWDEVLRRARELDCRAHLYLLTLLVAQFRSSGPLERVREVLEAELPASVLGVVRLHNSGLRGLSGYDGPRLTLYRFLSPFCLRGTALARISSILILPVVLPSLPELSRIYRVSGRAFWLPLLYLLEPLRLAGRFLGFLFRRVGGSR